MAKKTGEKYQAILHAAKEVFAEVGFHAATVSRIAKTAGIGDGTVYLYFENKEDILKTLFHETIYNRFVPGMEAAIRHLQDAGLMLSEVVRGHFSFFGADPQLARVIQIESRQSTPSIREAMQPGIQRYFRLIESIVEWGQRQGLFRVDISPRSARKMIFGTLDEMVTCWVLSTRDYPLLRMYEPAYKLFMQALLRLPPGLAWTVWPGGTDTREMLPAGEGKAVGPRGDC